MPDQPASPELRRMIADLLGVDTVEPDQNLFEIGFNSLTATALLSRIDSAHGVRLRLGDIFENPTARQLEEILRHKLADGQE